MKGTAIFVHNYMIAIVANNVFTRNGPVYSYLEYLYSPYVSTFSPIAITYYDPICSDEYMYFKKCYQNSSQSELLWPRVQGALYVDQCLNCSLTVSNCSFTSNEAGPMLDHLYQSYNEKAASQIYVKGAVNYTLTGCTFMSNQGLINYFPSSLLSSLQSYYPSQYFNYSMAPLINAAMSDNIQVVYQITVSNCQFINNLNVQVVQFSDMQNVNNVYQYQGSLINVRSLNSAFLTLVINGCTINSNFMNGLKSTLIYAKNTKVLMSNNQFLNNGNWIDTDITFMSNGDILYIESQDFGALYIDETDSNTKFPLNQYHVISNNSFLSTQARQGAAYYFNSMINDVLIQSNQYSNMFALLDGAILYSSGSTQLMTFMIINETIYNTISMNRGTYTFDVNTKYQSNIMIFNTTFVNTQALFGSAVNAIQCGQFSLQNCSFSTDSSFGNAFNVISYENLFYGKGQIYLSSPISSSNAVIFGGSIITQSNQSYSLIKNCTATNIYASDSVFMHVTDTLIWLYNVSIISSVASGKSIIIADGFSNVFAHNLNISNCNSSQGLITLGSNSNLSISQGIFLHNSLSQVGVIIAEANSIFSCDQCEYSGNYANDSTILTAQPNSFISFKNSQFHDNQAGSNLITLLYANMNVTNCTMKNNNASGINKGISMFHSVAYLNNVNVSYSSPSPVQAGFLNLNYLSSIVIANSSFANNSGSSVVQATGGSTVYISDTIFNSTQTQNSISASSSTLSMLRTNFINGQSLNDVNTDQSNMFIQNCAFSNGTGRYINTQGGNMVINNCSFTNGLLISGNGKAIASTNQVNATINSNNFSGLIGNEGGAIFLSQNTQCTLSKNIFSQNDAQIGGALIMDTVNQANLNQNIFMNNAAIQGGAVFIACKQGQACSTVINGGIFQNNIAAMEGGAISWVNQPIIQQGSITYQNNTAPYGSDIGSYPSYAYVQFLSNGDYYQPFFAQQLNIGQLAADQILGNQTGDIPILVSGTPFDMVVYILDETGNLYNSPIQANCHIIYQGTSSVKQIGNWVQFSKGMFNFSQAQINTIPGTSLNVQLQFSGFQSYGNNVSFILNPINLTLTFRNCVSGEGYSTNMQCEACMPGTYLLDPQNKSQLCLPCPNNAECFGGSAVAPLPGFWRPDIISDEMLQCPNQFACLGRNISQPLGSCDDGYQGILCAQCSNGYYQTQSFQCSSCQDSVAIKIRLAVGVIIVFLLIWLIHTQLNPALYKNCDTFVIIRIIINHFSVMYVISNIQFDLPWQLAQIQEYQRTISMLLINVFEIDCLFSQGSGVPMYYKRLIMFTILPVVLFILTVVYWGVFQFFNHLEKNYFLKRFTRHIIILYFLVYPLLTYSIVNALNCIEVDGVMRLSANIDSICFEGDHQTYVSYAIIPSLILWVAGIHQTFMVLLFKSRRDIQLLSKEYLTDDELRTYKVSFMKYGFLYKGYEQSGQIYWEMGIMTRKLALVVSVALLSPILSIITCLVIIVVAMLLQQSYRPYDRQHLNSAEFNSLQVAAITLLTALFYTNRNIYSDGVAIFFTVFVAVSNIIFFCTVLQHLKNQSTFMINRYNNSKVSDIKFFFLACMTRRKFKMVYIQEQHRMIKYNEDANINPLREQNGPEIEEIKADRPFKKKVRRAPKDDQSVNAPSTISHNRRSKKAPMTAVSPHREDDVMRGEEQKEPISPQNYSIARPLINDKKKKSKKSNGSDKVHPSESIQGSDESKKIYLPQQNLNQLLAFEDDKSQINENLDEIPNRIEVQNLYSSSSDDNPIQLVRPNNEDEQSRQIGRKPPPDNNALQYESYSRLPQTAQQKTRQKLPYGQQAWEVSGEQEGNNDFTGFQVDQRDFLESTLEKPEVVSQVQTTVNKKKAKKKKKKTRQQAVVQNFEDSIEKLYEGFQF